MWLGFGADYREEIGHRGVDADGAGVPAASSCAATPPSGINGITLITDAGYMMSGITGSFPNATMMAKVLMGRT